MDNRLVRYYLKHPIRVLLVSMLLGVLFSTIVIACVSLM